MAENKRLVPKRRFKEFQNADAWEERKLGEMSNSFEYGLNAAATEFDGENKYIRITDIDDESRRFLDMDLTSPNVDLSNADNYKLKSGDILFARTGASVGKSYIYKEYDGLVYYAGFLIRVRIKPDYDVEFVFQSTLTNRYNKYIRITSQRSGQPGVNAQEYAEFNLRVPKYEEQQKIGSFFSHLDDLVTLQQRKIEKLKALKAAYLSELFPQEGESVPKRRFAGFTGDWEQRKISEIFKVTRGQVLAFTETVQNQTTEMPYPVYSSQTKNNGLMGYYKDFLFDTAITWTTDGANAGTVKYRKGRFYSTNVNGVLLSDKGYANKAISEALNQVAWKYVSRVGNPKLMNNVMGDIVISLPSTIEEQNRISNFFMDLDNLITLQQRRLEKLQNIKKAYLNEMFI